MTLEKGKDSE